MHTEQQIPKYPGITEYKPKFISSQRSNENPIRGSQSSLKPENITTSITLAMQDVLQVYGLDFNPMQLPSQNSAYHFKFKYFKNKRRGEERRERGERRGEERRGEERGEGEERRGEERRGEERRGEERRGEERRGEERRGEEEAS
ncbi:hypothetical protein DUI87_08307 [Hirundo rustica rustica]|uniref:Uncharacterized protein n=1 Tax=Hirundo rustica rustica TaxID=333673 RepID=A0A3M0KS37_HIRRU|nr:hypothetical protein DUI87_08307 [Hirundo rustica rustica]